MLTCCRRCFQFLIVAWFCCYLWNLPLQAATITMINMDGPDEGLNDPTPVAPVGGNPGVTLGQQRLFAAEYAADIWGDLIVSDVEIRVEFRFDSLGGNAMSATLAGAGPIAIFRDFPGAPRAATFYVSALANALANRDLEPALNDIVSIANSDVDGNIVLGTRRFYYGFDRNAGTNVDFVTTFMHELGHGLGFASLIDRDTGAKPMGLDDAYSLHLLHRGATPEDIPSMTDAQRLAAFIAGSDLHWNGPNVKAASARLTFGASPQGDAEIFVPNPFQPGSSVSHFSPGLSPNELMEPFITGPIHDIGLTRELFLDLGWEMQLPTVQMCDTLLGGNISLGQGPCEEEAPNNHAATLNDMIGDTYRFEASEGDRIDLRVDTTDPNLDPVLLLRSANQTILAKGDNEEPCAVRLVCGHGCPRITGEILVSGIYSVIVLDSEDEICTGGSYEVTADGTGGIRLIEDDMNTGYMPPMANTGATSTLFWRLEK